MPHHGSTARVRRVEFPRPRSGLAHKDVDQFVLIHLSPYRRARAALAVAVMVVVGVGAMALNNYGDGILALMLAVLFYGVALLADRAAWKKRDLESSGL